MEKTRKPVQRTVARQIEGLPLEAEPAEKTEAGSPEPEAAPAEEAVGRSERVPGPCASPPCP